MQLIFTRSRSPFGALIRAFEGGQWDHVAVVDGDNVIEATALHGVRHRPRADLLADRPQHQVVHVDLPDERAALKFARSQVGKPYDWTAILGFLLWRDWSKTRRWYCSELAAQACAAGGLAVAGRQPRVGVRLMHAVASGWALAQHLVGA